MIEKREDLNMGHFKEKLEKELGNLRGELMSVGRVNPDNPADWEPTPAVMDTLLADINETADSIEEYENNATILKQLEIQFNDVKQALSKIEEGGYGFCNVCKEPISEERLEANPSSKTCSVHA